MSVEDCLFCKIIKGEIPSDKVYEDENTYAFRDINPAAPHHILIIPKEHISSIRETEDKHQSLIGELMLRARTIAKDLGLDKSGYRLVMNAGPDGGQTVDHIHLHLVGGRKLEWPPG